MEAFPKFIKIVNTDYKTVPQLSSILASDSYSALVILVNRNQRDPQLKLIDAAISAQIPHVIPSSFGFQSSQPKIRAAPFMKQKIAMQDYIIGKANEGHVTYTIIDVGWVFDVALKLGTLANSEKPVTLFDGGDREISVCSLDLIGQAVTQVVLRPDRVQNRDVRVQSAAITQNQILRYAGELVPGKAYDIIAVDSDEFERRAYEKLRDGESGPDVMRMFIPRLTFGLRLALLEDLDNDLLGLKQMCEEEVKAFVGQYVQ